MFTEATAEDCDALATLAATTFTDAFGHLYRPENLAGHLAAKFSADFFRQALIAGSTLLLLKDAQRVIGYAKVGEVALPVKPPMGKGAQEIHRVYVEKSFQGRGLGKALMLHILALPRVTTAPVVYLGVWEENLKAQSLYKQYGFAPVGRYLYPVGDQADREIIMARRR